MDIERFKRLSIPKIEAGKITEVVRDVIKEVRTNKQNVYEKTSEDLKPLTETFDKEIEEISKLREDVNKQVVPYAEQVQRLALPGPSGPNYGKQILDKSGKINKKLGQKKASLSTTKINRKRDKDEIAEYTKGIDIIKKYRQRIGILEEGAKTLKVGQGIYTQKKRNAYKINPNTGVYGDVTIDVPKLYGQLKLIAHKDGKKVYDKQVDFDTLDLLTKRFNSKKKYLPLSKMVFDDLKRISDIPIHRTSNKYKKIGAGVVYYNNPADLLDRLELLGGSILAGNNGVKNEFSKIAHTLNKLGVQNNPQLNSLLKEYVI
ncbi:uncharacterized protein [Porites lutea]|uniref:uncharacterized protein n=1 Tax=Porites lutea TaxID=51062 RepID=UPI003CC6213F